MTITAKHQILIVGGGERAMTVDVSDEAYLGMEESARPYSLD